MKYIEIPDTHIGLGDTICAITCFFGIQPCGKCISRRHWCNEWFPYKWNTKKLSPTLLKAKQMMLAEGIRQYPFIMNSDMTRIIPLEDLPRYSDSIFND